MARLLLRPGWILTHLAVIAIAVAFVNLGLWQLERNAEREADSERVLEIQQAAPIPFEDALATADPYLRPVTVTGTYLPQGEVQLSPRSRNEIPGYEILTPLALPDGRTLVVNRGWIPLDSPVPPPPPGTVSFEARVREPAVARQVLPVGDGPAQLMSNVDLARLDAQIPDLLDDAYVDVVDEEARLLGVIPRPAEPAVAEGSANNMSYAIQWFAFTIIGLIGYPLLLKRRIDDHRLAQAAGQSDGHDAAGQKDAAGPGGGSPRSIDSVDHGEPTGVSQ